MCKYDVTRKTRSTQHIATPPEEDRATAIANMRTELCEIRTCSEDRLAEREITYKQTDMLITILRH